MRRPFIAGNWKMFTAESEAIALAKAVLEKTNAGEYDVAVCPPAVHLSGVRDVLAGTHVAVGAQDVHWENSGAFTGEISVPMIETYCDYVIIGHSERRQLFGETNETVNKKLLAVLDSSLLPIVAIGETEEQRRNNETEEVLAHQIVEGFTGVTLVSLMLTVFFINYVKTWNDNFVLLFAAYIAAIFGLLYYATKYKTKD